MISLFGFAFGGDLSIRPAPLDPLESGIVLASLFQLQPPKKAFLP